METTFNQVAILAQTYQEVQERFCSSHDLAHGWDHVSRVYGLALEIAAREGADGFIVGMAALLHDLGQVVEQKGEQHHVDLSLSLAADLLQRQQVPIEQQQAILHAIAAHSFSRGVAPQTLEACVVRDADRLDALGAIGIMRWAIVGAQRRTSSTLPYHPEDPFVEQRAPDDRHYMLDHFFAKLLKLVETMTTESGRQLAEQRTAFMRSYLDQFKQELDAKR